MFEEVSKLDHYNHEQTGDKILSVTIYWLYRPVFRVKNSFKVMHKQIMMCLDVSGHLLFILLLIDIIVSTR